MGIMHSELLLKLQQLAKNQAAFEELKQLFTQLYEDKKATEKHLQLLERAISNDYDSIIITELELEKPGPKIVYVNDGFTKLTGYSKNEVIGKTPRILQGPKTDRATLDRLVRSLHEGKSFFGQAVNYRKDGSEFINQWDIHPLYDESGKITHWVSYQHDITKRKHAEATFNETEIEFDNLIEFSKRTLIDINVSGKIIQANKAFRTLTGFENAELTGHNFVDFVEEESAQNFLDLLANPETSAKHAFTLKTKNHIPIQIEVEKEFHPLKSGDLIRLTVHNVSMQKQVLKTLEHRLFNIGSLIQKKTEFSYELSFDNENNPHFSYLSDGFEELTGYDKSDFYSAEAWEKLIAPEDHAKTEKHLKHVLAGLDMVEEIHIVHASGKKVKILNYSQLDLSEKEHGKIRVTGSIVLADET
jgi:PAS domain S-box-containing protein